jgi:hypothetical protein
VTMRPAPSPRQGATDVSGVKRPVVQNHSLHNFSGFSCKSRQNREPTSGLEPLTCSSYELDSDPSTYAEKSLIYTEKCPSHTVQLRSVSSRLV